jgi:hypothetical protein
VTCRARTVLFLAAALAAVGRVHGQFVPYDPYADSQEVPAPLAADGTVQWGVFYKSAETQTAYLRLWNLGACRGSNRRITEPVNRNKLLIDRLPEADYEGTVVAASGTLAGGLIAFRERGAGDASEPFVVQLHPAGVTRLQVAGPSPATVLRRGHVVRVVAQVDHLGEAARPLAALDIVTPATDFRPDPVEAGRRMTMVGEVERIGSDVLILRVPAGRIRRLRFSLTEDAVATIDAAQLDLVAAGDAVSLTGRLWAGDGSTGAGTIFSSKVSVTKPPLPGAVSRPAVAVARP